METRVLTSDVVAIGGGTSTATENVGSEVVDLLTVLVSNDGATGGTSVSSKGDAILTKFLVRYPIFITFGL